MDFVRISARFSQLTTYRRLLLNKMKKLLNKRNHIVVLVCNIYSEKVSACAHYLISLLPELKEKEQRKPMLKYKLLSLLTACIVAANICFAQNVKGVAPVDEQADSIRISLITCDSGEEIYTLFGHTAIRYEEPAKGIDVVFNYGLFSFNTPNFILRFALGQTDYQLGAEPFGRFMAEYEYYGRDVWQQTLNLSADEKEKFVALLMENLQPENRVYRYNFFFDNCATRPRDKMEEAVNGKISYGSVMLDGEAFTFRDVVRRYAVDHPWARFGMDFCLGSKADKYISERELMFVPFFLEKALENATLADGRVLSGVPWKILDNGVKGDERDVWDVLTPLRLSLLLFIAVVSVTIFGIRKGKSLWFIDMLLFAAAGLAGCVIFFLAMFSEHPAVSPNYLLAVFHPLHLVFLIPLLYSEIKHRKSIYHVLNVVVLTLFIVLYSIIPQSFDFAVVPLALCLLVRSASNLILTHKPTAESAKASR